MTKKEVLKEIFVADDGKEFETEKEANEYEKSNLGAKYFVIYANPDLSEGKVLAKITGILKIEMPSDVTSVKEFSSEIAQTITDWFGYQIYGNKYGLVMGHYGAYCFMESWRLEETTYGEALRLTETKCLPQWVIQSDGAIVEDSPFSSEIYW